VVGLHCLDQPHLGIKTAAEVTVSYRLFVSMVSKKSTQRRHNRRLEAVHLCQHSPSSSFSAIAKQMGCRHGFVKRWVTRHQQLGHVRDSPRSGRPHKATAAAVQHVLMAAQLPECTSAADIAARTKQDLEVQLSRSSVTRILKRKGMQHLSPKVVPLLTAMQKAARIKFARAALRTEVVSWRRVLITDSKYFKLYAMGKPAGRWCTPASRGTLARPKTSIAVHAYMGCCRHGTTTLKFVTGTHKQASKHVNPKTKRLHTGVGQDEYHAVIQEHWVPEGNRLFQQAGKWADNWQLQQDNAPPHKTAQNMAYITANVPGGHFLKWPANSPDLSPIENLWAWMDHKLHKLPVCKNVEELKQKLEEIRQSIPACMLHAMFDGMPARMKRVVALNGDYIGK